MVRPYLSNIINDHKTQGEWKIQLAIAINFMSSKDSNEMRTMHSKSHNLGIKQMKLFKNFLIFFTKISKTIKKVNERKCICFR